MDNVANLEKSMKNSSATTAPTTIAADIGSGLTSHDPSVVFGGAARAHEDGDAGFTLVTRSKRGRDPTTQKEGQGTAFSPLPSASAFKDPFGLARVSGRANPVSMARTKQTARRSTQLGLRTSPPLRIQPIAARSSSVQRSSHM